MEAMAFGRATSRAGRLLGRLSHLWQVPVFLVSIGCFAYAGYRFVAPRWYSAEEKLGWARLYLKADRPEKAIDQVNELLNGGKLQGELEGQGHLIIAEALEAAQRQGRFSQRMNHANIIEQSAMATALGVKPTGDYYRRVAESFEALDRPADALKNYQMAIRLDEELGVKYKKKVVELQLESHDKGAAESIERVLSSKDLSPSERAWAVGQKAQLLIDEGDFARAKQTLDEALKLTTDPALLGPLNYRMGVVSYRTGRLDEAERYLRVSRDQLKVQHPTDADAALLLGQIMQKRGQYDQAIAFYQGVLTSHPDSSSAPAALLGRGVCRVALALDEGGLTDLKEVTRQTQEKSSRAKNKPAVVEGLKKASEALAARGNYGGAIEILSYEQELAGTPGAEFYARLGVVYEKRAEQVERAIPDVPEADRLKRVAQVRDLRRSAGDAYVAYSTALTVDDDKGYGEALWRGIDLYDRAGDVQRTISALERFVNERADDPLAPDALLRLGRAYQAAGQFDKAIASFQRNQFRYPNSLAASKSAVPLAQAFIAKGSEFYGKAETVLKGVVENNPLLTPKAEEFKQALFELGQLYYRTGRYEEAVARLEEWVERYPTDARLGQLVFLMADSYRKSSLLLDAQLSAVAKAEPANGRMGEPATRPTLAAATQVAGATTRRVVGDREVEASAERRQRLTKAKQLYDRLIDWYRANPATTDLAKLQLKLSHFYRADCLYDLGEYAEAVKLYDAAALRYQEDPSALAAYVQIVNAYFAMGKVDEAKTANERAKWLLRRMPQEAFEQVGFTMPREYWDQWLKWAGDSGMWK